MKANRRTILALSIILVFTSSLAQQFFLRTVTPHDKDQSETAIAVSPLSQDVILGGWNDFRLTLDDQNRDSKPGFAFSTDAGNSWSGSYVLPAGYVNGFDPSVAFDNHNHAFYCYVASNQYYTTVPFGPVYVSRTSTNSLPNSDWSQNTNATGSSSSQCDKPYMAVDNTGGDHDGNIYVSWTNKENSGYDQVEFAYSPDGGATFYKTVETALPHYVPEENESYGGIGGLLALPGHFSMPVVGPDGTVYLVYDELDKFDYNASHIKISKSTNGGQSFVSLLTATDFTHSRAQIGFMQVSNIPCAVVSPTNGHIFIVYMDNAGQQDARKRIKLIRSTNQGSTFTHVTDDLGTGGTHDQFYPWMSIDGTGRITVVYQDQNPQDPTHTSQYLTESKDDGSSFASPFLIEAGIPTTFASNGFDYQGVTSAAPNLNYMFFTAQLSTPSPGGNTDPEFAFLNSSPTAPTNLAYTVSSYHPLITWDQSYQVFDDQPIYQYDVYQGGSYLGTKIGTVDAPTHSYLDESTYIWSGGNNNSAIYRVKARDTQQRESAASDGLLVHYGMNPEKPAMGTYQMPTPSTYSLSQNSPNPFNPSTEVSYTLPEPSLVMIVVYDRLGREVKSLVNANREAGYYDVRFEASTLPSGMYFCRMQAGKFSAVKKMLLMK